MEENKKVNAEEVETKENSVAEDDRKLSDEELEKTAGGYYVGGVTSNIPFF